MEEIKYPVRINKYLAYKKICARREADELIIQKKVRINGKIAVLGDKVNENDKVVVADNATKKLVYLAFNKPKGVITHSPQLGEKEIKDIVNFGKGVFPVGRLDKNSSGLIILTNDGRLTDKLLNPEYNHQKEYIIKANKKLENLFFRRMADGVKLDDGYVTKKCSVTKISSDRFSIILTEGKKHQIRRMCDALGYGIVNLERRRIMNIKLGSLQAGDFREIKGYELSELLKSLGLS
ncbi:MAG: pseudouridine synthase [Candidatus Staskawiczbacteria bacterium]|nr:pseudouridine synthase [Candidatus Staskawiczbacteria bacterium]